MDQRVIEEIFSHTPKRLSRDKHINPKCGFLLRTVYGKTERFVYHTHDFYEVFLTVSGTILHCVNKKMQVLEPGCLVFMRPDDVHCYLYSGEDDYNFVNLAVSSDIIEKMMEYVGKTFDFSDFLNAQLPPIVRLSKEETKKLLSKMNSFNLIDNNDVLTLNLKIRTLMLEIFCDYLITCKPAENSEIPLWLSEVCDKMKRPDNFCAGIKRMVELSGKSQEHLSRMLKKHMGVTISEYINELRANYAANLIRNTNLKITDICYESGFGNISRFYTVFNEMYGMPPNKFRATRKMK